MYCTQCSSIYPATASFCETCGCALVENSAVTVSQPRSEAVAAKAPLKGIGGWLILVGIGLFGVLVARAFRSLRDFRLLTSGTAARLSSPHAAGYIPGYLHLIHVELSIVLAMIAVNAAVLILFVRESRWFPRAYIAFLIVGVVVGVTDHILATNSVHGASRELQERMAGELATGNIREFANMVGAAIWILYTSVSKRVKNTFVR
jgi:hypothetical protein